MPPARPASIDEYIAAFPEDVRQKLEQLRASIRQAAPEAAETIKYGMPTFTLAGGNLAYFAAYKAHIGLYSIPAGLEEFAEGLVPYQIGKGSVRLPLAQPLPLELIARLIAFNVRQLEEKQRVRALLPRRKWGSR